MPTDTNPAALFGDKPDSPLTIADLTRAMNEFVTAKGWYAADSPHQQSPRNIAASLVIEAAEVLEHFQWGEDVNDRGALAGELADVMLYLLQLASVSGIDLQEAVLAKLTLNYGRSWD